MTTTKLERYPRLKLTKSIVDQLKRYSISLAPQTLTPKYFRTLTDCFIEP